MKPARTFYAAGTNEIWIHFIGLCVFMATVLACKQAGLSAKPAMIIAMALAAGAVALVLRWGSKKPTARLGIMPAVKWIKRRHMFKTIVAGLIVALAMLITLAPQAATPSPTIPTYQCGIDTRRNPDCTLVENGSWTNSYGIAAGAVISLTMPAGLSGTTAGYTISPPNPNGSYLIRNMGEGTPPQASSNNVTDGTAWVQNKAAGYIQPPPSGLAWVAIKNNASVPISITISWASMTSQTTR